VPESYSEHQLDELDRLIEPWLDDYERTSRAARKSPRTPHSRGIKGDSQRGGNVIHNAG
jgi:hypothetical protein